MALVAVLLSNGYAVRATGRNLNAGHAQAEDVCARLPGRPEPPVTVYSLSTLVFSQTFDLAKAREQLQWSPCVSPQDAILRAAAQWKHHAPV